MIEWVSIKEHSPNELAYKRILVWTASGRAHIADYTESLEAASNRPDYQEDYREESWCVGGHEIEFTHWAFIQEP